MKKLNKLLNDLSKHPTSFKNIEDKLQGVHLSDDMVVNSDETMILIDYKFKGFIVNQNGKSPYWTIDVDIKNQDGEILNYKVNNQKLLKERVYELLIKISDVGGVLKKINS
jgi:hypothetical protein